ncbi:MAG: hypothetical protein QXG39_01970 [Candidatus Aenigmatarchaeota archaeon]
MYKTRYFDYMLEEEVLKLLEKAGIKEAKLEIPKEKEFGDLAFPCFELAKKEKRSPIEIANGIVEKIKSQKSYFVKKVEQRNGYVNFFFDWGKVSEKVLKEILKEKS